MAKFNPFRPGSVVTPGMFTGRGDEIICIEQGLFQTKNGNPAFFIIEGERGIGKSSLLLLLDILSKGRAELEDMKLNFIVASTELTKAMDYDDIINAIITELRRQLSKKEKIKEMCKNAWDFLKKFEVMGVRFHDKSTDRGRRLDELTDLLADIIIGAGAEIDGILILIDEADKPAPDAHLGELCKLLTERLARRECERVSIVLAGLPDLVPKLRASHESSPRIFSILSLAPLEYDERKEVVDRGLSHAKEKNGFETKISDEAMEIISTLSEGYPHFLQEFAYCAFAQDTDDHIDTQDVLDGAYSENGALDQLGKKYFAELYIAQIGSEDYRKVLNAMAESLDGWVDRQTIITRSGVKERTVDNALRALKDRNIVIPNERVRGEYRLPTKSFAVWIKAREAARLSQTERGPQLPGIDTEH